MVFKPVLPAGNVIGERVRSSCNVSISFASRNVGERPRAASDAFAAVFAAGGESAARAGASKKQVSSSLIAERIFGEE